MFNPHNTNVPALDQMTSVDYHMKRGMLLFTNQLLPSDGRDLMTWRGNVLTFHITYLSYLSLKNRALFFMNSVLIEHLNTIY